MKGRNKKGSGAADWREDLEHAPRRYSGGKPADEALERKRGGRTKAKRVGKVHGAAAVVRADRKPRKRSRRADGGPLDDDRYAAAYDPRTIKEMRGQASAGDAGQAVDYRAFARKAALQDPNLGMQLYEKAEQPQTVYPSVPNVSDDENNSRARGGRTRSRARG